MVDGRKRFHWEHWVELFLKLLSALASRAQLVASKVAMCLRWRPCYTAVLPELLGILQELSLL